MGFHEFPKLSVVGLWLGHREARKQGLPADDIISVGQWAILAGLAGARVYEVVFNWDYYGRFPAKIFAVWEGGLAMHGGLIVGPLVGIALAPAKQDMVYSRLTRRLRACGDRSFAQYLARVERDRGALRAEKSMRRREREIEQEQEHPPLAQRLRRPTFRVCGVSFMRC